MDAEKRTPMDAVEARRELDRVTAGIIRCAQKVSNVLGHGFVERVYENALCGELERRGIIHERQRRFQVWYEELLVGEYFADVLVEEAVIVELKAVERILDTHRMQCLNYLKASKLRVCLLINFGRPRLEVRRVVYHF